MGLLLSGKNPAAYKTAERSTFTATAGQTTFTVPVGYNVGDIDVFLNGLKLVEGDDFYATNGTTVVLASGANAGDSLSVVCYYNFLNSSSYTKSETDARYIQPNGSLPMTSYLRTPNYGISSTSDSSSVSLEASAFAGEQGVGVKAFGRSIATTGGDILYTADSRGAGGRHRFGYWNGTSFTNTMSLDTSGRMLLPYQPAFDSVLTTSGGSAQYTTSGNEIVFNAVNNNRGGHYNSTNGRFTAPVTGTYVFFVGGMTQGTTWLDLLKNGGSFSYRHNPYATSTASIWAETSSMWVVQLNANEYVSVFNYGGGIYGGGNNHNNFSGYLLG